jgi:ComF family protein
VFRQARSVFLYQGTGARLVHALKYEGGVWLQLEITALLKGSSRWSQFFGNGLLVPVPLHRGRMRARGYNQAEIIARALRKAFPDTDLLPALERIRDTPSQTFLNREERLKNLRRAFSCTVDLPDRRLVLVDDVLTTGATLNAAAEALSLAGTADISAFTLAHG